MVKHGCRANDIWSLCESESVWASDPPFGDESEPKLVNDISPTVPRSPSANILPMEADLQVQLRGHLSAICFMVGCAQQRHLNSYGDGGKLKPLRRGIGLPPTQGLQQAHPVPGHVESLTTLRSP